MDIYPPLKKYFGFTQFKGLQEEVIKSILQKKNTFVIMPTGGGKSLCYQLPALMNSGTAIVISPLIALMKNQVDAIRGISDHEGVAHVLNSSLNKSEISQVKSDIENGITKLLYVAPESLIKEEYVNFLKQQTISFVAIDEAHCISEWGHDFRPEYRKLKQIIDNIGQAPVIALTATATPKVRQDIMKNLKINDGKLYLDSFNRSNLFYEIRPKKDVAKQIIQYISTRKGESGIVYCLSRKKVEEIAETLQINGIKALPYHAGLEAKKRVAHQEAFLMDDCDVIVATIAFGMGIDKPDIRYVVHHDIPKSLEGYYQETGRGGRDGGEGHCLAFYDYKDIEKLEKFMQGKPIAEQEVGRILLEEVVAYAETAMSRRKFLLHYFGEEYDDSQCVNMCDNCRFPRKKYDAKEDLLMALQVVEESNEKFKSPQVANVLIGNMTAILKTHNAASMDNWSKGKEKKDKHWSYVIRQAIVQDYLDKDIESYGVLKLKAKGKDFIAKPYEFIIPEETDFGGEITNSGSDKGGGKGAALDQKLYNELKDETKKIAKSKKVPPYAVFSEASLNEMATIFPCTLDELKNISGVGEGKAKKFGKTIVEIIADYVAVNDIDRPMDLVFKSVANKSVLKVYIIQSTDRKLPLGDIASAKGLAMDDLIKEMEIIVNSGTKIDINYYLEDILDEDSIEEVFDFFLEDAENGSIEEAVEEFGSDFSEEELRLVRMKFLSDVAN